MQSKRKLQWSQPIIKLPRTTVSYQRSTRSNARITAVVPAATNKKIIPRRKRRFVDEIKTCSKRVTLHAMFDELQVSSQEEPEKPGAQCVVFAPRGSCNNNQGGTDMPENTTTDQDVQEFLNILCALKRCGPNVILRLRSKLEQQQECVATALKNNEVTEVMRFLDICTPHLETTIQASQATIHTLNTISSLCVANAEWLQQVREAINH